MINTMKVYIVLTPVFEGRRSDPSLAAYEAIADKVFDLADVGVDTFLTQVETFERSHCV